MRVAELAAERDRIARSAPPELLEIFARTQKMVTGPDDRSGEGNHVRRLQYQHPPPAGQ